jgi:hypothetical protein
MSNIHTQQAPSKLSRIDVAINAAIIMIFIADLLLVTVSAGLLLLWENDNFSDATYLGYFSAGVSDANEFNRFNG